MSAFTRRGFLNLIGAAGSSVAVYQVAMGLGLIPAVARAERPDLAPLQPGQKKTVVILGAGMLTHDPSATSSAWNSRLHKARNCIPATAATSNME